jgi:hypothetical protein
MGGYIIEASFHLHYIVLLGTIFSSIYFTEDKNKFEFKEYYIENYYFAYFKWGRETK